MKVTVREPATKTFITVEAYPEDYQDTDAWRIQYPGTEPFLLVQQDGEWMVMNNEIINIEVAEAVIEGLKHRLKTGGTY